tara:strand:- start:1306 stop:1728 length:423 start_codon:yes stop_codon:yes gene_type:complete
MAIEPNVEKSILDTYKNLGDKALKRIRRLLVKFKKRIDSINAKKDSPEAKKLLSELRKDISAEYKEGFDDAKKEKTDKTLKRTGPSQSDIMGGAKGPAGPLGAKLEDKKKKKNKNKKSMMKGSSYDPRKANRAGQRMGQR